MAYIFNLKQVSINSDENWPSYKSLWLKVTSSWSSTTIRGYSWSCLSQLKKLTVKYLCLKLTKLTKTEIFMPKTNNLTINIEYTKIELKEKEKKIRVKKKRLARVEEHGSLFTKLHASNKEHVFLLLLEPRPSSTGGRASNHSTMGPKHWLAPIFSSSLLGSHLAGTDGFLHWQSKVCNIFCVRQGLLYQRTCKPDFLCSWPSLNSYLK